MVRYSEDPAVQVEARISALSAVAERIIARRLAEHEANMRRCVEGIKTLAERD